MAGYPVPQPHPGSLADLGRALLRLLEIPDKVLLGVGLGVEQPEAVHDFRSLGDQLAQQLPGTGSIFRGGGKRPHQLSPAEANRLLTKLLHHHPSRPIIDARTVDSLDWQLMRARAQITKDIIRQHEQAANPRAVFDDHWKLQFGRYGRRPPVPDQHAGSDLRMIGKHVRQKQRQLTDEYRRTMPPSLNAIAPPPNYDPRRRSGR